MYYVLRTSRTGLYCLESLTSYAYNKNVEEKQKYSKCEIIQLFNTVANDFIHAIFFIAFTLSSQSGSSTTNVRRVGLSI